MSATKLLIYLYKLYIMKTPMEKIMNLIDRLPESDRSMIAGTYYMKPEKELSSKVTKMKKIFDKLADEDKCDFIKAIWARKMWMEKWPMKEWDAEVEVEIEITPDEWWEEDLDPNKE